MVVLSAPFSQVSGAPVAVSGGRTQSVTSGSGLSMCSHRVQLCVLIRCRSPPLLNKQFRTLRTSTMQLTRVHLHGCNRRRNLAPHQRSPTAAGLIPPNPPLCHCPGQYSRNPTEDGGCTTCCPTSPVVTSDLLDRSRSLLLTLRSLGSAAVSSRSCCVLVLALIRSSRSLSGPWT